ncbi:fumarylacetoacetate hydrolase family protein [Magnetospirillum sp. 64-120]|uniref:fumarylacetoacetate hydrolase family protein n=1 Tax=Magnetospirillum sp. 64-120 TaxID=1895778 RepID=UPI000928FEF0|nr:fumarylacetoacetate hydrolase family protein [Magnetospirillum sp. 64-120]OJX78338.1 MAG: fumarylacetoacetase [Magnetospirillum sp. 64-120]
MTSALFTLAQPVVPILGQDNVYPVRRVFCVGRNYAGHAREMGSDPNREPPFYFSKSADSLVPGGGTIPYAPGTSNLHHEIELVVALGKTVFQATPEQAAGAVYGHAVGLDMTRRDLQNAAKDIGRPWDLGKSFEFSAPITALVPSATPMGAGAISLEVNGQTRQKGDLNEMIWSVPEVIAHLSQFYHLGLGDLIYTGTPEGVSAVKPGDTLVGRIDGLPELAVTIGPAA